MLRSGRCVWRSPVPGRCLYELPYANRPVRRHGMLEDHLPLRDRHGASFTSRRGPRLVVVHCVNQLCTTDVLDTVDGGQDTPAVDAPAADAALDARQPCGDDSCGPGQACFLIAGGAVPLCLPAGDAGTCGTDMVRVASCSVGGGPTFWEPGCTTPPPSPRCYDVPDACADPCSCVCPSHSPWGCGTGPGYLICPAQ